MNSFCHIPKNAGTSIRKIFNPPKLVGEQHACLQEIYDNVGFDKFYNQKFLVIVRDPLERLYSWWNYHKSQNHIQQFYHKDFNDWVKAGCRHHWVTSPYFGWKHGLKYDAYLFAPINQQNFYLVGGKCPQNILFIKQEDLGRKWNEVKKFFGKDAELKTHNDSKKSESWRSTISPTAERLALELCKTDYNAQTRVLP